MKSTILLLAACATLAVSKAVSERLEPRGGPAARKFRPWGKKAKKLNLEGLKSLCRQLEYEGHDEDCVREIEVCTEDLLRDGSYTDPELENCVSTKIPTVLRDRNDVLSRTGELNQTCQGYPILECYFKMQNCNVKARKAGYVVLDIVTDDYVYKCAREDVPKAEEQATNLFAKGRPCLKYKYNQDCRRELKVCNKGAKVKEYNMETWSDLLGCMDERAPVVDRERDKILSRKLDLEKICKGFSDTLECYFKIQVCKPRVRDQGHTIKDDLTDPIVMKCVIDELM